MRIFEFQINGEREWVAAYTFIEAIQTHSRITDMDLVEYDSKDEIVELPKEKWNEMIVKDPDEEEPDQTFAQWMDGRVDADIIASTAYLK